MVNGVSKSHSMTGWRIGYAAGPKDVITAMANIQSQSTSNPASISQKAAVEALRGPQDFVRTMNVEFDKRRKYMVERLNTIPGVTCLMPVGAFYAFPRVSALYGRETAARKGRQELFRARGLSARGCQGGARVGRRLQGRRLYPAFLCNVHGEHQKGLDRIEEAVKNLKKL